MNMRMLPNRFNLDSFLDAMVPVTDMKCDIYEKDGAYHIEADMPGYKKEDVNVEYEDGYLTISAARKEEEEEEEKNFIRQERVYGSMKRKFYVGDIEEEKISANFNDGVLQVVLPEKAPKNNSKSIEIK